MASDPAIRKQVVKVLEDKQYVSADTMEQLRAKLGIECSLGRLGRATARCTTVTVVPG